MTVRRLLAGGPALCGAGRRVATAGWLLALAATFLVPQTSSADPGARPFSGLSGLAALRGPVSQREGYLVDDRGRVVLLHGTNVTRKVGPRFPVSFGARDAAFLASEGFTSVRLGLLWASIEPTPGHYDERYLRRFVELDRLFARYGIRTIIDVHEDTFSETYNGDGAPSWASLAPGTPSGYELAWKYFWDDAPAADGVGIQTRFVRMWAHLAREFVQSDNVLGYNPLNEPQPGLAYPPPCYDFLPCPAFEQGALSQFYLRVIAAIRTQDGSRPVLLEGVAQNGIEAPAVAAFDDPQAVFNMHLYCVAFVASALDPPTVDQAESPSCPPYEEHAVQTYETFATQHRIALLDTEFSSADTNSDNARAVDLFDAHFIGWNSWAYYNNATDPSDTMDGGLLVDDRKPGSACNAKSGKLDALVVPYPQVVAGTPIRLSYDRTTRRFSFRYTVIAPGGKILPRTVPTQVFIPKRVYPHGYRIAVTGARVTSPPGAAWVTLERTGSGPISLTISPHKGARTRLPVNQAPCPG